MMSAHEGNTPIVALLDNGSIRAQSTVELRKASALLARSSNREVLAVSLDHSDRAPLQETGENPAVLLEEFLQRDDVRTGRQALVVPFFLGNRGAIARRMEKAIEESKRAHPQARISLAPYLFEEDGEDQSVLALALTDNIKTVLTKLPKKPRVILVDHGSPVPMAAQVRNFVAGQVQALLGDQVLSVTPASMERREGNAYAFTDPLLEVLLRRPKFHEQPVLLAMFFLLPGKHAGPDGDVAEICQEALEEYPRLQIHSTRLLAQHPFVIEALAKRIAGCLAC